MKTSVARAKPAPYVDPSALLKLYLHEPESSAMNAWRRRNPGSLQLTRHGRIEIINGLCLATFRKLISAESLKQALGFFDEDLAAGHYADADVLWRATLSRAADLCREFTVVAGCRTLDAIHVASAIELGHREFLTFDLRQQQLARACGLKIVAVKASPR
jgi:predicted nucleic acid-binding protein